MQILSIAWLKHFQEREGKENHTVGRSLVHSSWTFRLMKDIQSQLTVWWQGKSTEELKRWKQLSKKSFEFFEHSLSRIL